MTGQRCRLGMASLATILLLLLTIAVSPVRAQSASPEAPGSEESERFLREQIKPIFDRLSGRPLQLQIIVRDGKSALEDRAFSRLRDHILDGDSYFDAATGRRYAPGDAVDRRPVPRAAGEAEADTMTYRQNDRGEWIPAPGTNATACMIFTYKALNWQGAHKNRRGQVIGQYTTREQWFYTLAHELYHCYQPDILDLFGDGSGAFIGEGAAEVAAAVAMPGNPQIAEWSSAYAEHPRALRRRSYDASGLFGHLYLRGVDVFAALERVYAAGQSQDVLQTFIDAIGPQGQAAWAMSEVDQPAFGGGWVWRTLEGGNARRLAARPRETLDLRSRDIAAPETVPQGGVRLYRVLLPENKIVKLAVSDASGAVRSDNRGRGDTREIRGAGEVLLCHGDRCPCVSPGRDPSGEPSTAMPVMRSQSGEALVALVGAKPSGGHLQALVSDDRTAELLDAPSSRKFEPFDQRLVGIWEPVGVSIVRTHQQMIAQATGKPKTCPDAHQVTGTIRLRIWADGTFEQTYTESQFAMGPQAGATCRPARNVGYHFVYNGAAVGCAAVERPAPGWNPPQDIMLSTAYASDEVYASTAQGDNTFRGPRAFPEYQGKKGKLFYTSLAPPDHAAGRRLVSFVGEGDIEIWSLAKGGPRHPVLWRRVSADPGRRPE